MQWTVDTCVLEKCNDFRNADDCVACTTFLCKIAMNGQLCLDFEGTIEDEYSPYIAKSPFLSMWWRKLVQQVGYIVHRSSNLYQRHERYLLDKLNFDDDDIKFVGTASRTEDKIIVSGWDSDYCPEVCEYLKEDIGISVITPYKAIEM